LAKLSCGGEPELSLANNHTLEWTPSQDLSHELTESASDVSHT